MLHTGRLDILLTVRPGEHMLQGWASEGTPIRARSYGWRVPGKQRWWHD